MCTWGDELENKDNTVPSSKNLMHSKCFSGKCVNWELFVYGSYSVGSFKGTSVFCLHLRGMRSGKKCMKKKKKKPRFWRKIFIRPKGPVMN